MAFTTGSTVWIECSLGSPHFVYPSLSTLAPDWAATMDWTIPDRYKVEKESKNSQENMQYCILSAEAFKQGKARWLILMILLFPWKKRHVFAKDSNKTIQRGRSSARELFRPSGLLCEPEEASARGWGVSWCFHMLSYMCVFLLYVFPCISMCFYDLLCASDGKEMSVEIDGNHTWWIRVVSKSESNLFWKKTVWVQYHCFALVWSQQNHTKSQREREREL